VVTSRTIILTNSLIFHGVFMKARAAVIYMHNSSLSDLLCLQVGMYSWCCSSSSEFAFAFAFAFAFLSHWVHAAIGEGSNLSALKCSSHWFLGSYLASIEVVIRVVFIRDY
jgi:hypothetical protein